MCLGYLSVEVVGGPKRKADGVMLPLLVLLFFSFYSLFLVLV